MTCDPPERLKVLFLTNWYPTKNSPGAAVWVREHAKAVQLYDDVVVLHWVGPDRTLSTLWRMECETDAALSEGVPTYRGWYRPSPVPGTSYLVYLWSVLQAFRHFAKQQFHPDVIHVQVYDAGFPAILHGRLNGIPVVVSEHFSSFPRRLLGRLDVCKAWLAFRWAQVVLPVSGALQKAIESYGIHAHFRVVPNVADPAVFFPGAELRRRGERKQLIYVGRLVPIRGLPYLLRALADLRQKRDDWHLDIVGDGTARTEYERLAMDLMLGEQVTFHGHQPKSVVAALMRHADLFVLPSLYETFSAAAAEALTTGTPVLATRCGGPEEFIVREVGQLVPPGDVDALRDALNEMLDSLPLYSCTRISQYAVDRFAPRPVGAQFDAIYRSVSRRQSSGKAGRVRLRAAR